MLDAPRTAALRGLVRVLGIDPGSRVTGYGVIERCGGELRHVAHGCIRCADAALPMRLQRIHSALVDLIAEQRPDEAAVESVFVRRNVNSALVLGQARGVALLALAQGGLIPHEYAPAQVKSTIVGTGRAEKRQIQHMVCAILKLPETPAADAADALAIALCHARLRGSPLGVGGKHRTVRGVGYRNYGHAPTSVESA
ncbi:MAG TPA: crossover junction endodeoxyribonuclease RuvC [Nevskiaceae bacterium]